MATDADGTLWSSDVGDRLFLTVAQRGDLRPRALERLRMHAAVHLAGVPDDPLELVRTLLDAYANGRIEIAPMCELEAEAVGDRTESELRSLVDAVGEEMATEIRPLARELLEGARSRGMGIHVVTGSLAGAVEAVLRIAGMPFDTVSGAMLRMDGGVVMPHLSGAVPLFEGKVKALSAVGCWPAALGMGDGGWDVTFLRDAFVPVLMHPKQALVDAMAGHPRSVTLHG